MQIHEPAVAYFRTSSAANVGEEKDSLSRQRAVIERFAVRDGLRVVGDFYDSAVSGAEAIEDRPGFAGLLDQIETNGVRTVIVEDVSRFAREMKAHVLGIALLRERGVRLLSAVDGQNLTEETDEMTEGMVTIMAVFAQIEKKRLVKKLAAARKRKHEREGRCEGRKPLRETRPEVVALARKLRRRKPKAGRLSLRSVSKELAARGFLNERGKPYAAKCVARMLG